MTVNWDKPLPPKSSTIVEYEVPSVNIDNGHNRSMESDSRLPDRKSEHKQANINMRQSDSIISTDNKIKNLNQKPYFF